MSNSTVTIQENSTTQVILWFFCVLKLNILFSLINTLKVNFFWNRCRVQLEHWSILQTYQSFLILTICPKNEPWMCLISCIMYLDSRYTQSSFHCQNCYILNERVCFCWMEIFCKYQHDSYELIFLLQKHPSCSFSSQVQKMGTKIQKGFSCVFLLSTKGGFQNVESFLVFSFSQVQKHGVTKM
jgi:hypothetical protein